MRVIACESSHDRKTAPPAAASGCVSECVDLFLVKGFPVLGGSHAFKLPEQFHEMLFIRESTHGRNLPNGQGMAVQQIF